MSTSNSVYVWRAVPAPKKVPKQGVIRHRLNQVWVDGALQDSVNVDVWEKREDRFKAGQRVVLMAGMGDYELGIYVTHNGTQILFRGDGYIDPAGVRHEPYSLWVNPQSVATYREDGTYGKSAMQEGYTPIPATPDE